MRTTLIGADFEENLGIGILASCLEAKGHTADILPFNVARDTAPLVARIVADPPGLVGLSIQFQHRAPEFLGLSRALRKAGYRGHITCGAQFPTLAFKEILETDHGLSSVVLHDGEETLVELVAALESNASLDSVAGLALRGNDGLAYRTTERRMPDELDLVPFPRRYRDHNRHMGVPFVPLLGGRGCWSKCSYCSIVAFYRDGREHGGGRLFRLRSPENVAQEMALLWHRAKGPCIFCFHDDNFTLPSPDQTLTRVKKIRDALDDYGVGTVGLVGKARPDTITPELAKGLFDLGVIRLYVGVENASQAGGDHLRRGTQQAHVRSALKSCREAGIFNCYNLLVFEPGTTLADVHENADFIRDHADHPVNFCRAEPYHGTPLHLEMQREMDLGGSYLGWNYRITDDRSELLFRVCAAAFRERNFAPRGVANRYMGLGYAGNILRRFYAGARAESLRERARLLTRAISLDTYEHLSRALELVEHADLSQRDNLERHTARLALGVSAKDREWQVALDELYDEMSAFTREPRERERWAPSKKLMKLAKTMTVGATMFAAASATEACSSPLMVVDPPPPDMGPRDLGGDSATDATIDGELDAGLDATRDLGADASDLGFVVDPVPPDSGQDADTDAFFIHDPPVPDPMSMVSPGEAEDDRAYEPDGALKKRLRLVDQWRDSSPQEGIRTNDLPLFDPPAPEIIAVRDGDRVRVTLKGVKGAFSTRWESLGEVKGDGAEVEWVPADAEDMLSVAVRTRGGVAVVTVRAQST